MADQTPAHTPSDALRIQTLSRRLALACLLLMGLLPLLVPLYWLSADTAQLAVYANLHHDAIQKPLSLGQRLLATALTELPVLCMVIGLQQARHCFMGFARGEWFSASSVRRLRAFAGWVMASALAALLIGPLLSICLTLYNEPGSRQVAIGLSSSNVLTFFFSALMWLMAGIIAQGQALAEENKSFI